MAYVKTPELDDNSGYSVDYIPEAQPLDETDESLEYYDETPSRNELCHEIQEGLRQIGAWPVCAACEQPILREIGYQADWTNEGRTNTKKAVAFIIERLRPCTHMALATVLEEPAISTAG